MQSPTSTDRLAFSFPIALRPSQNLRRLTPHTRLDVHAHAAPTLRSAAAAAAAAAMLLAHPPTIARPAHAASAAPAPPTAVTHAATGDETAHALAEEAWHLISDYYLDPTFNHTNWARELDTLRASPLHSPADAYAALRRSVRKLEDRYTRILTPKEMAVLRKYDVSGVGLLLTKSAAGELLVATDPLPDTAAGRAGVRHGDVVTAVDGRAVAGAGAFEVAEWMQGADGSAMRVTFRDRGTVSLTRSFVRSAKAPAVSRATVIPRVDGRLGYIRLASFPASSRLEVAAALRELQRDHADWVVLDLRGNGGGVFEGALEIAALFEGDGIPVARVTARQGAEDVPGETYVSRLVRDAGGGDDGDEGLDDELWRHVPLGIVLDGGSASSSEVLAGGLRDRCRAALIGERSFGKGLIQGVFGLSDGGGVVVTVGEYRTPSGRKIQGRGLDPDIGLRDGAVASVLRSLGVSEVSERSVSTTRDEVASVLAACRADDSGDTER